MPFVSTNLRMEPHGLSKGFENTIRNRKNIGDGISNQIFHDGGLPNEGNLRTTIAYDDDEDFVFTSFDDVGDKKSDIDLTETDIIENVLGNLDTEIEVENPVIPPEIGIINTYLQSPNLVPKLIAQPQPQSLHRKKSEGNRRKVPKKRRKTTRTSQTQPIILSTMEIDKMFKNFRKIQNNGICGRNCDCYFCSLLNYPSEDDSDEEQDNVTVAYGFESSSIKESQQLESTVQSKTNVTRRKLVPSSCYGDQLQPAVLPLPEINEPKCKLQEHPVGRMPSFVTNFERIMNETREYSMMDSLFDSIIYAFVWIWSIIKAFLNFVTRRSCRNRKVAPELPLFQRYTDQHEILDSLASITVIKHQ